MKKRILSSLWKIAKYTSVTIVLLALFLVLWLKFIAKDIPPVDDSFMKISYKPVPPLENGYTVLAQAAGRIIDATETAKEYPEILELDKNGKLSPETAELVMFKYKERFDAFDRAITLPYSQAPRITSPGDRIPSYLGLLTLARLRLAVARLDFDRGRTNEAAKTVRNIFLMGSVLDVKDGGGGLVVRLVGAAIKNHSLNLLNDLMSEGYFPLDNGKEWISLLDKNKFDSEALKNSFRTDYLVDNNVIRELGKKDFPVESAGSEMKYISPGEVGILQNDFIRGLLFRENRARRQTYVFWKEYVLNVDKTYNKMVFDNYPILYPISLDAVKLLLKGELASTYLFAVSIPNMPGVLLRKCLSDFSIDGTRLRIALLAWKKDHGALPPSLESLVPEYIASVPSDPFDGKPIRYEREKGIIYSVGINITDDGGQADELFSIPKNISRTDWNKMKDLVIKIK